MKQISTGNTKEIHENHKSANLIGFLNRFTVSLKFNR